MKLKTLFSIIPMVMIVLLASCNKDDDNDNDGLNPVVLSTDPISDEMDVVRNKAISVTFSEAMDESTINSSSFTLKQGTSSIAGDVSYAGVTATFTPSGTLAAAADFTATVTTSVKSSTGRAMEDSHTWTFTTGGSTSGTEVVNLGTSGNYVVLAKTAVNNSGTSEITGDLGLSPAATSYITGFALTNETGYATSDLVTGKIYASDMADPTPTNLTTAVNDMNTAYNDAAGRTAIDFLELGTGNIGGKTLTPGIYKWTNTVTVPSSVTISGNSTDVWIFLIAGDLSVSSSVEVLLSGGAQPGNIFWQVAGEATFGTTSHFEGIILSKTGITFQTGASLNGRALAQTAVVLDATTIVQF
ncbi:MAG: ice-binding family protein [Bacteroidales bacterium]